MRTCQADHFEFLGTGGPASLGGTELVIIVTPVLVRPPSPDRQELPFIVTWQEQPEPGPETQLPDALI